MTLPIQHTSVLAHLYHTECQSLNSPTPNKSLRPPKLPPTSDNYQNTFQLLFFRPVFSSVGNSHKLFSN